MSRNRSEKPSTSHPVSVRLVGSVFRRELGAFFLSPGSYVALTFFFLLAGAFFTLIVADFVDLSARAAAETATTEDLPTVNVTEQVITQMLLAMNFLFLILIPMLTMRLLAEEKRSGAFELLVTTPLGNWDLVLGKYLAALALGIGILLVTAAYPVMCFAVGARPEIAVILVGYLGLALLVAAYTAFGLFASALTESQIAAGVLAFVGLIVFQMIDWLFKAGLLGKAAAALSLKHHIDPFTQGIVALTDIAYFIFFIAFFLFLTVQVLDARRWRA